MTTDRWQQIENLYNAALEKPTNRRAAILKEACSGDEELLHEVESLLNESDTSGTFLERPAMEVAARLLSQDHSPSIVRRKSGA
jgi:eukaryotic-like serine/threonine-protein kinase